MYNSNRNILGLHKSCLVNNDILQSAMELPILVTAGYAILNDATSEED
jgi:hypothetical protein